MRKESYFNNNTLLYLREGDEALFGFEEADGKLFSTFVRMDGYVILPQERYQALLSMKSPATEPPEPSART